MLTAAHSRNAETSPIHGISRRRRPKRRLPPEVLTDAEVRALMSACGRSATGLRNQALIALLYRSGLRIREALELRPKDLDLAAGAVRVLYGKGGTSRTAGLDAGAAAVVTRWLDVRACHGATGLAPVFCTLRARRLTEAYVRVLLPRLARRAGIEKRVHAHGLRHTHAAQLRAEGMDIGLISKQLGHRSIATTARYLDHIAPAAVVEAIGARVWG
ncbi:MAG: phage integrase family protein [Phycisphaerae bacterium]|nr:phage integrase family protein [Phycisphaerae bacterium]